MRERILDILTPIFHVLWRGIIAVFGRSTPRHRGIRILICAGDYDASTEKAAAVIDLLTTHTELVSAMKRRREMIYSGRKLSRPYYEPLFRSYHFPCDYFERATVTQLATDVVRIAGAYSRRQETGAWARRRVLSDVLAFLDALPVTADVSRLRTWYTEQLDQLTAV